MALSFLAASSQLVQNSATVLPTTGYPLTIGAIVMPTTTGAVKSVASFGDAALSNAYLAMQQNASDQWAITARGAGSAVSTGGGSVVANRWYCLLARFISATNRRLDVYDFNTSVVTPIQNTTSVVPTNMTLLTIGATAGVSSPGTDFFSGLVGEYWYTKTDIQPGGLALSADILRTLAWGGPFSLTHLAGDILEYRSFRKYPTSDEDELPEVYSSVGRQTWANTNGTTIGANPPLPYSFVRPGQNKQIMMI